MAIRTSSRLTLDKLMRMSGPGLEKLYRDSAPGPIPDGESVGRATLPSEREGARAWETLFSLFWTGKVFRRDPKDLGRARLVNKTLLGHRFPADVYYGESKLDGGRSIIIDYERSSPLLRSVRDEIRLVGPDLYLGYAYVRLPREKTHRRCLAFALDFSRTLIEQKIDGLGPEPIPQAP